MGESPLLTVRSIAENCRCSYPASVQTQPGHLWLASAATGATTACTAQTPARDYHGSVVVIAPSSGVLLS